MLRSKKDHQAYLSPVAFSLTKSLQETDLSVVEKCMKTAPDIWVLLGFADILFLG